MLIDMIKLNTNIRYKNSKLLKAILDKIAMLESNANAKQQ